MPSHGVNVSILKKQELASLEPYLAAKKAGHLQGKPVFALEY